MILSTTAIVLIKPFISILLLFTGTLQSILKYHLAQSFSYS